MGEKIQVLNNFFKRQDEIVLLEEFVIKDDSFWGSIKLSSEGKEDLLFKAKIPLSYPLSNDSLSIRFWCQNAEGHRHMNDDNSICLVVPKHHDFESRLKDEIKLLKEWRDKFYLKDTQPSRYEYLITPYGNQDSYLFTDVNDTYKKGEFGLFTAYNFFSYDLLNGGKARSYYIQTIGEKNLQWSDFILNIPFNENGWYYFIEDEPILFRRKIIKSWQDLNKFVTQPFLEKLYNINFLKNENPFFNLLIGYRISDIEINWQLIKVKKTETLIKAVKKAPRYYEYLFDDIPLNWSKTINASYERFFGRGKLSDKINNKNILILGIGAIGSSIAELFARGGCKQISVCDIDIVEPGNICRSQYFITQSNAPKYFALTENLYKISPFLEIKVITAINKRLDSIQKISTRELLSNYDLIIDCTSDAELSYVLDHLNLETDIINISISNKAMDLVCIAGQGNITNEKAEVFKDLNTLEENLIYEGTGCWSPTFEASYFDINGLLNLAIKNLNTQIENIGGFHSFKISVVNNNGSINYNTIDY